jgi:hypothetical protein
MSSVQVGSRTRVEVAINSTDLPNNVTQRLLAPDDGFLAELAVVVTSAVTTGGTIKVQNSAGQDVGGLSVTIPNGAAVGTIVKATATKGDLNRPCVRDSLVTLVPAGFATAGAARAALTVRSNDNPQQPY